MCSKNILCGCEIALDLSNHETSWVVYFPVLVILKSPLSVNLIGDSWCGVGACPLWDCARAADCAALFDSESLCLPFSMVEEEAQARAKGGIFGVTF